MKNTERTPEPTDAPALDRRPAHEIAEKVEPLVLELIEAHESMIKLLETHRAAISSADPRNIEPIISEERVLFDRIAELERRTREALGHKTGQGGLKVSALAESLAEPARSRLASSASYLRALHARGEVLRSSVREASLAMAVHLDGLMRQVAQRLSHAGTYGQRGRVESAAPVVSGLDVSL